MTSKYLVRTALAEDINAPYIWFSSLPCDSRDIVRIINRETSKSIWCQAIKAGDNFIVRYNENQKTLKVESQTPFVVLNEWYREKLDLRKNETSQLEVRCYAWLPLFLKQLLASYKHPDNTVRLAVDLSLVALILGVIGLVLGFASFWK
jgi:hypothetical protein